MLHKPSPSLRGTQKELMEEALQRANWRMRDEMLEPTIASFMERYSVAILPVGQETLRYSWNPLQIDHNAESGFGMVLDIQDAIVGEILRNEDLYDQVEQIVSESVQEIMTDRAPEVFLTTLLQDLIEEDSFYGQFEL